MFKTEQFAEHLGKAIASVKDYAIFMLSPEGEVLSWNKGGEQIKGYQAEEIIGKSFTCFYTQEEIARGHPEAILRQAKEQGSYEEAGWQVRKDGSRFWADVTLTPIYDNKKFIGFTKVTRDLTDHLLAKKNELMLARYQQLVKATNTIIWTRDAMGNFTDPQLAWELFTGQSYEEYQGLGWLQAYHPEDRERVFALWKEKTLLEQPFEFEGRLWNHQMQMYHPVTVRAAPTQMKDAHVTEWTGIVVDIYQPKQTENQLREALAQLKLTLESAQIGIWSWDLSTNTISMDNKAFSFFGLSPVSSSGPEHTLEDFLASIHEEDQAYVKQALQESIYSGKLYNIEFRIRRGDTIKYVISRGEVRHDLDKPTKMLAVSWDNSDQKLLEQEQLRAATAEQALHRTSESLAIALEAIGAGVWSWKVGESEQTWDNNLFKMLGIKPDEIASTYDNFIRCIHPEDRERVKELAEIFSLRREVPSYYEFRVIWPDGSIHYIASRNRIQQDTVGQPIGIFGICVDITDRKLQEDARHQEALKRAEIAERQRKDQEVFIDTICHELRNPLNGILGNLDVQKDIIEAIKELTSDGDAALRLKDSISAIEVCAEHQRDIINQVLEISKLELHKIKLFIKPFSLNSAIHNLLAMHKTKIQQKKLQLNLHLPAQDYLVESDEIRFKQIIINLLANAINHTPEEGVIDLSVQVMPQENNQIQVEVQLKDSGVGFSEEEKKQIFERFSQLSRNKQLKYESSGLGLAISKQLTELLKGELQLESQKWHGSTFTLRFNWTLSMNPAITAQKAEPVIIRTASPSTKDRNKGIKILVVEDNDINQKIFRRLLEKRGYTCAVANDGVEAVEIYKTFKPHLIFMDIEMPRKNGFEATKDIRQLEHEQHLPAIPIYAVTGYVREEYKERSESVGMTGFISKPFKREEIMATIENEIQPQSPISPSIEQVRMAY